jgi:hypothetical protein
MDEVLSEVSPSSVEEARLDQLKEVERHLENVEFIKELRDKLAREAFEVVRFYYGSSEPNIQKVAFLLLHNEVKYRDADRTQQYFIDTFTQNVNFRLP